MAKQKARRSKKLARPIVASLEDALAALVQAAEAGEARPAVRPQPAKEQLSDEDIGKLLDLYTAAHYMLEVRRSGLDMLGPSSGCTGRGLSAWQEFLQAVKVAGEIQLGPPVTLAPDVVATQ